MPGLGALLGASGGSSASLATSSSAQGGNIRTGGINFGNASSGQNPEIYIVGGVALLAVLILALRK